MTVTTIADIAGSNTKTRIATSGYARWVQFSAVGGSCRVGDANVSATQGQQIPSGQVVAWPMADDPSELYALGQLYTYVPTGTTLTVTVGR